MQNEIYLDLQIKNLTKVYNKGTSRENKALDNIELNVKKGEFFGLLGPNGAGKSTLIGCLSTTVNKTSGDIHISGYNLDTETLLAKKSIGIVPQELNLDPFFTPLQTLMLKQGLYGITPNKNFCLELLYAFGLKGKENTIIRMLSGGMKRRVLITGALVHSPKIVILDEPTAGVDVELRKIIWDQLIKLNKQGTTIILTTHYLEEAEALCERIAVINKGKVVANDKTSNLVNNLGSKTLIVNTAESDVTLPDSIKQYLNSKTKNSLSFTFNQEEVSGLIINELCKNNIPISNIKLNEAKLEDVFIQLIKNSNNVSVAHLD